MCGIFGFVGTRERAEQIDLSAAVAALHHRGPDGNGMFRSWDTPHPGLRPPLSAVRRGDGGEACALASTRLAILDLSPAGAQPMSTPDGRYTIVYNGEVYNFADVRRDLLSAGDAVGSSGDAEVVLKAYARWGPECLYRFRGMFAIAIWDARERSLFLGRDRLGIKPLYYAESPQGVAFASEVRALLETGCLARKLSPSAVVGYLAVGSVVGPDAIIAGARSLPPGHWARFDGRNVELHRYWQIPNDEIVECSFDQAVERVAPVLRESARLHLVSDVPLGIFLSGGVDSSSLACLASAASVSPVHTFTVTFDEAAFNEEKFAAEVASRFGCDHHQVHLSARRAAEEIGSAVGALDQPSADGLNTFFVAKAARQAGLSVALSGLGGDELFGGYDHFRTFGRAVSVGRLDPFLGSMLLRAFASFRNGSWDERPARMAEMLEARGDSEMAYGALRQMFGPASRRRLLEPGFAEPSAVPASAHGKAGRRDAVNTLSALELSNYLRNTLLRDTDAMSMAHSLEVRVPFLDHILVETMMTIPGHLKVRAGRNKPLLTESVGGLPEDVVTRRKMGFALPMDSWFRGALRPWLAERLADDSQVQLPFLRREAVGDLWRTFLHGGHAPSWSRVWCLAALAGWCEANRVTA